jgi:hypothetical protein
VASFPEETYLANTNTPDSWPALEGAMWERKSPAAPRPTLDGQPGLTTVYTGDLAT